MRRVSWNLAAFSRIVTRSIVTPRMRRVSWNVEDDMQLSLFWVTPRMRRVSWNLRTRSLCRSMHVTPRMRRVSWNSVWIFQGCKTAGHASHEACELKCRCSDGWLPWRQSRLAWGVWVEISMYSGRYIRKRVTPRMRRVSWNAPDV